MNCVNPNMLLLLLPISILLVLKYLLGLRSSQPVASLAISLLRFLVLALLITALAQPYLSHTSESTRAYELLDISDSIESKDGAFFLQSSSKLGAAKVEIETYPFAKSASVIPLGRSVSSYDRVRTSFQNLDTSATNLELAFKHLLSEPPGSIILLSDGQETTGNVASLVSSLSTKGLKVFPFIPPNSMSPRATFEIAQLHAPLISPAEKSVEIRATLRNSSLSPQSGTLRVKQGEKLLYEKPVRVNQGEDLLIGVPSDPSAKGIQSVTATLDPNDQSFTPTSETIYISGEERQKVLVLSGSPEDAKYLAESLSSQAYQLESLTPPFTSTPLAGDISHIPAIILNNVALNQLPTGSADKIKNYVKNGGGLAMIGGNRGFGLGGYAESPIDEALPLQSLPPQTAEKRLNVAVSLVMDKSRSMFADSKIDFAKEAAREVIRNLKDQDLIGVIGFDSAPFVAVNLGYLRDIRSLALDRVGRLFPAGRTNLLPAIEEARRSLNRIPAGRKHVIILTDGKLPDEGPYYLTLTRDMRLFGITISTVLIGNESDPGMLRSIAEVGGGAFYQTADPRSLPRIFMKDIYVHGGEQTLKEESEYLVRLGTGELKSTDVSAFPPLRGYVQTKLKERANLELVCYAAARAEPLLASWQYGKGRSIAFTSDANGRWSNFWISWAKYNNFWSNIVDALKGKETASGEQLRFDLRTSLQGSTLQLDLAIFANEQPDGVYVELTPPNKDPVRVDLSAIAPGRFRGSFDGATAGRYELHTYANGRALTPVAFALKSDLFGERKGQGFNLTLLNKLASATNGKINPSADELRSQVYTKTTKQDLSHLLLCLALALICLEILWREVWNNTKSRARKAVRAN